MSDFLPTTAREIKSLGWTRADIILITGDAYIDHPAFGTALIGRILQAAGYKVAVLAQPDWRDDRVFLSLGSPELFFGVSSGNMDSMVNHYTARKKPRSEDAYSPDGKTGLRPDRATLIYSQKIRSLFGKVPIILGGIEASLRRIPHYDYWSDRIRNSILFDSRADMIVYGMGEKQIVQIAEKLATGNKISDLDNIPGTVTSVRDVKEEDPVYLGSYAKGFTREQFRKMDLTFRKYHRSRTIYQEFSGRYLRHNPPPDPPGEKELDSIYGLPFLRRPHPSYGSSRITAFEQIGNSITSHRGCLGGCSFCALSVHQGRDIRSRSIGSILTEIDLISSKPDFKGTISDIGGPTANMYGLCCTLENNRHCRRESCLFPSICNNLDTSHGKLMEMLKSAGSSKRVKNLFIASGIRHDLALKEPSYMNGLVMNHTGGILKLAPEHKSDSVLKLMKKPGFDLYEKFRKIFSRISRRSGKRQVIVPYVMVGHPGESLRETLELATYLRRNDIRLTQVQEFTPTPMTQSTTIYFTGQDETGREIHIPGEREKRLQKALVQWFVPENRKLVIEALKKLKRQDLFGFFLD